ncbi:MAG: FemAB family XrtA/PEP-CTERM system-associated protein [Isosphaeraceae bacterium]|jgi:FemAB-related protein (PEP-CTERM system-associated)
MTISASGTYEVRVVRQSDLPTRLAAWESFVRGRGHPQLSYHPAWPSVLRRGLGQVPYVLEVADGDEVRGLLPLVFLKSPLFGRFLVGLPYLNYGGVISSDDETARLLIDRAVELAEQLDVRHLELRHEQPIDHPRLVARPGMKVHMRLALPRTADVLWKQFDPKVRNQIRKGEKNAFQVNWGGLDLLPDFYAVFSRNMRDLGTPVYPRGLFRGIVQQFPDRAEFCVVRLGHKPLAAALLLHGWGTTEVPSASSLREYNSTCVNMLMYWQLLQRTIDRGQEMFDFGRSSPDGPTYKFKAQWGAVPVPASWQFHFRAGDLSAMRPDNPRYERMIRVWKRLPLCLTRMIGPVIVRGIP